MDDEDYIRDTVSQILCQLGYTVQCAATGSRAFDLFRDALSRNEPFDAAILDLTIPGGMGGKETLAKMLALQPDFIGIATSGYLEDPVIVAPEKFGFKASFYKPTHPREFGALLAGILADRVSPHHP
jgi:two-component system, cell cycle sensor histidine kinase and response regulator CckA